MPFEDMLVAEVGGQKCKTCKFLAALDPKIAEEVRVAMTKTKYSHEVIARGLIKLESEFNIAPKDGSIRNHRLSSHA